MERKIISIILVMTLITGIFTMVQTTASAEESVTVNGEKFSVGDVISYRYYLQTPGKADNFQGYVEYSTGLQLLETNTVNYSGIMVETNNSNIVYYSGSNPGNPYDFTTDTNLYNFKFKVVDDGAQTIENSMYIISGSDGTDYYYHNVNYGTVEHSELGTATVHHVAGSPELCNGVSWSPLSSENVMSETTPGKFEITYKKIPAGSYQFKVTTNGEWEPSYNLNGLVSDDSNSNIKVTDSQAPAKVKISFDESEGFVRVFINGVEYVEEPTETTTTETETQTTTEDTTTTTETQTQTQTTTEDTSTTTETQTTTEDTTTTTETEAQTTTEDTTTTTETETQTTTEDTTTTTETETQTTTEDTTTTTETKPELKEFVVSAMLELVTSNNEMTKISEGSTYTATFTAEEDCIIVSITVSMGGEILTSSVIERTQDTCTINIPNVSGDISIIITADKGQDPGTFPSVTTQTQTKETTETTVTEPKVTVTTTELVTEQTVTIPTKTEPTVTVPTETDPTKTEPTVTLPTETEATETKATETDPTETDPTKTEPTVTLPTETEVTETEPTETGATETEPTETEPTVTVPTETEPQVTVTTPSEPSTTQPSIKEAQKIIVTKAFKKYINSKPFNLNAKAKTRLSYSSSNIKVATVSSNGKITIKGIGTAVIAVKAAESGYYKASTQKVTVKVGLPTINSKKVKIKKTSKTSIKISWKKVNKITGYVVSVKVIGGKSLINKRQTKTTLKLKGLKKGKKLEIKARTYKKSGKKYYYSKWITKKITVK